jgi:hypothetical protein
VAVDDHPRLPAAVRASLLRGRAERVLVGGGRWEREQEGPRTRRALRRRRPNMRINAVEEAANNSRENYRPLRKCRRAFEVMRCATTSTCQSVRP